MKKYLYISVLILSLSLVGCSNWLEVKPKAQIESGELFETESGFKDALWGVYVKLVDPSTYGREMTFGTVDVLGQVYSDVGEYFESSYQHAMLYDYTNAGFQAIKDQIWHKTYNAIANVNNLIAELEKANVSMFSKDNYNVILGEAYGLRAFLHFDMLRLFGKSYLEGASEKAIPYVVEYDYKVTPLSTVSEVIDYILDDLLKAESLLKNSDPIITKREITSSDDNGFLMDRKLHFNYYGVKAELARVYLYKADYTNALACANEVINSRVYSWTSIDKIATVNDFDRDRTFGNEQIFALKVTKMEDNIRSYLNTLSSAEGVVASYSNNLTLDDADRTRLYPDASDWRLVYFWGDVVKGTKRCCTKYSQYQEMPEAYAKLLPLIRLPEMYLISAESTLNSDLTNTASKINQLWGNRGISATISASAGVDALQKEIIMEYKREFILEGQTFYCYKRLGVERMDGVVFDMDKSKYVLPMPNEEIEYGQRN